ncbi:MAG: serpin family protein [Candidatus Cyclobacteriaceae bacterium M3_2C_046]
MGKLHVRFKDLLLVLSGLMLIWSCERDSPEPNSAPELRSLNSDEKLLIESSNNLVFKLLNTLDQPDHDQNFLFSPVSIGMELGMSLNGASGKTREAILQSLHIDGFTEIEINKAYSELINFLSEVDPAIKLNFINSLWFDHKQPLNPLFRDKIMAYYQAESEGLDLTSKHARNYINRIIESKSLGNMVEPFQKINGSSLLMFNGVFFEGDLNHSLWELSTRGTFQNKDKTDSCDLLLLKGYTLGYYQDDLVEVIEIPQGNRQFSLTFMMSARGNQTNLSELNLETFRFWLNQVDTIKTDVLIPRFAVDKQLKVSNLLPGLGLSAITASEADFSQMVTDNKLPVSLQEMYHQATFKLGSFASLPEPFIYQMNPASSLTIDRPFLYFIREKHSGMIIFAGKVSDPNS